MKIYLDHNATTPMLTEVRGFLQEHIAQNQPYNPSSAHRLGREAKSKIEGARKDILNNLLGENSRYYGLVFVSSCTEANNQIIRSFYRQHNSQLTLRVNNAANPDEVVFKKNKGERGGGLQPPSPLICSATEHSSSIETAQQLGCAIANVNQLGQINTRLLEEELAFRRSSGCFTAGKGLALVSVSHANAETGVLQNINKIADLVQSNGAHLHCDMAQSIGKTQNILQHNNPNTLPDYISISGHKLGAPVGIGGLIYKKTAPQVWPIITGGGQERGLRSGTQSVMLAQALSVAIQATLVKTQSRVKKYSQMQTLLEDRVEKTGGIIIAKGADRITNTSLIYMPSVPSEVQLAKLDISGICVSIGSACSSGKALKSTTLGAMGIPNNISASVVRVATGEDNTIEEIEHFCKIWGQIKNKEI